MVYNCYLDVNNDSIYYLYNKQYMRALKLSKLNDQITYKENYDLSKCFLKIDTKYKLIYIHCELFLYLEKNNYHNKSVVHFLFDLFDEMNFKYKNYEIFDWSLNLSKFIY